MDMLAYACETVLFECQNTEYMTPYYVLCERTKNIDPNSPIYDETVDYVLRELVKDWKERRAHWDEYVDALEYVLNGGREYEAAYY